MVSVIIPLYNKASWVERCVQSVISQTYKNIEILIVNDGSTDNSREVVAAIDDPGITIIDKPNGGVSSARNLGIEKANGEYIAFLDADDEWKPKHLEVLLAGFEQFKDAILVCDDLVEKGDKKKESGNRRELPMYLTATDGSVTQCFLIGDYLQTLKDGFFILSASSILIKLSVIRKYQLHFCEQMSHGEDMNYWLQLNRYGKFVFCDYLGLLYHRIDDEGAMNKKTQEAQLVPEYFCGIDVKDYHKKELDDIKKFLSREYYKKAYQNRGLSLKREELSTVIGGGIKIGRWNVLPYLAIRYCPQFVFDMYKKIKNRT